MSEVDDATAAALGWPKTKYASVERERRWLCVAAPVDRVLRSVALRDLYLSGTQLRLRSAVPLDGSAPTRRLTRKADVTASTRLVTSVYLTPDEYDLLAALPGQTLVKTRHYVGRINGADVSVDEFGAHLAGLVMAEAEFDSEAAMRAYPSPEFAVAEVTEDRRYSGGELAYRMPPSPSR
jgi:CYTH domain-containing protein